MISEKVSDSSTSTEVHRHAKKYDVRMALPILYVHRRFFTGAKMAASVSLESRAS